MSTTAQLPERLLHDTGRAPLFFRLAGMLFGIGALWISAHIVCKNSFGFDLGLRDIQPVTPLQELLGFFVSLGLGLFLVSVWFMRNQIYFNTASKDIIIRHTGLFGRSARRIPTAGAIAVHVRFGGGFGSRQWNIEIAFAGGSTKWVTQVGSAEAANRVAEGFSEVTELPIEGVGFGREEG